MTKNCGVSLGIGYRGFALYDENRCDFHRCWKVECVNHFRFGTNAEVCALVALPKNSHPFEESPDDGHFVSSCCHHDAHLADTSTHDYTSDVSRSEGTG
jgi:hypothetical protein